jgi:hypothetical protein
MKNATVNVMEIGTFHHLPDNSYPPVLDGLTVRQALAELRLVDWGDMGGLHPVRLSDGTWLAVQLENAVGGGELMGSQTARRLDLSEFRTLTLRKYRL